MRGADFVNVHRIFFARPRSRYGTHALNRGDPAACESHFNATLPTGLWFNVIPFHDCSCSGGDLLTTYRRAYQGGDCLSCHPYSAYSMRQFHARARRRMPARCKPKSFRTKSDSGSAFICANRAKCAFFEIAVNTLIAANFCRTRANL